MSAATLDWLYDVTLPVVTQATDERTQSIRDGLQIVLHRVTGLRTLPESEEISQALSNAESYQLQFRYEEDPEGIFDASTQRLVVTYDESAVRALIRSVGMPIWSAQRPRVLFIFSVEGLADRTILGAETEHVLQRDIEEVASRRGLEIRQPLMDLTDLRFLNRGSIAFEFFDAYEEFLARYDVDILVTAKADRLAFGNYRIGMLSVGQSTHQIDVFEVSNLVSVATEVVNRTADSLASRFAVERTSEGALVLVVGGVYTLTDYKRLIDYLEKWEFIDHVLLRSVEYDRFEFELLTASSWDQFIVHLEAEGMLLPHPDFEITPFEVQEFTWRGSQ